MLGAKQSIVGGWGVGGGERWGGQGGGERKALLCLSR